MTFSTFFWSSSYPLTLILFLLALHCHLYRYHNYFVVLFPLLPLAIFRYRNPIFLLFLFFYTPSSSSSSSVTFLRYFPFNLFFEIFFHFFLPVFSFVHLVIVLFLSFLLHNYLPEILCNNSSKQQNIHTRLKCSSQVQRC